jgi:hypothetical protein
VINIKRCIKCGKNYRKLFMNKNDECVDCLDKEVRNNKTETNFKKCHDRNRDEKGHFTSPKQSSPGNDRGDI